MFYLHIFQHEMFCYLLPHDLFYLHIFRREKFYLFPRDRRLVRIFPSMRRYSISYPVTDFIRDWIYKYFMTCNVLLFLSPPFTNIGLYMFSGIRYLFYTLMLLLGHAIICCLC